MKRRQYPEAFERFWSSLPRDFPLGSKPNAMKEFEKLECTEEDVDFLIESYVSQVQQKLKILAANQFTPQPPHVERWLRHARFDDAVEQLKSEGKDEQRRAAYAEFLSGDLGEDLGLSGSQQARLGTRH